MILCCGESLIDMLPRQATTGETAFAPHAGGAVFNTAIALGRLGAPVAMFTGLASDFFGDLLAETLESSKVSTQYVHRADAPCTVAFVKLVDGHATYAFYDENTAGRMLSTDALPDLADDVNALFFGGISLVVEPCGATYEALMTREAANRVTMIDPNIRPGFIKDEAAYRARIDRMMGMADIVKLSDEDLAWLMGGEDIEGSDFGSVGCRGNCPVLVDGVIFIGKGTAGQSQSADGRQKDADHDGLHSLLVASRYH